MGPIESLEVALERAFGRIVGEGTPPRLAAAMRHAVFPGGARFRPALVVAVAEACGRRASHAAHSAAVAIELVHCASLVHDDLPCFDNAPIRRGRISVHAKYGESLAVLVGDGLIVGAFEELATAVARDAAVVPMIAVLARAVGANGGLVAGQGWEAEPSANVQRYHHAKTAALFEAATCMGALAAGVPADPWRALGAALGEAYQIADDIADLVETPTALGKPVGQDLVHARPSAAIELGVDRAFAKLDTVVTRMSAAVPPCAGATELREWLLGACTRLFPHRAASQLAPLRDGATMSA
jgi:geranylgeranyl diphosphate synthase type II